MRQSKWFFHPILIFIYSILAVVASLFLYINWYVKFSTGTQELIHKFNISPDQIFTSQTWSFILLNSLFLGVILMGITLIFVYNQKAIHLYQLQNTFINNFTHELKTPVTSLKLYLETFYKHDLPREEQIKYIQYMLNDVNRLSENIGSILNIAKIESKCYSTDIKRHNMVYEIETFLEKNEYLFSNCQITTHYLCEKKEISCSIDISLFEMLLMNIIFNGIKYNQSDKPTIQIYVSQKKKKVILQVVDNGIGIPKKARKKVFKKFYQCNSDKRSETGSGLGLYLVYNIVRLHKGRIFADQNDSGQGSRFTIELPE